EDLLPDRRIKRRFCGAAGDWLARLWRVGRDHGDVLLVLTATDDSLLTYAQYPANKSLAGENANQCAKRSEKCAARQTDFMGATSVREVVLQAHLAHARRRSAQRARSAAR